MTDFDTEPVIQKRKHRSPLRVIVNGWGCLLAAIMLGAGLVMGLAVALLFGAQLFGFDATSTALAEQAIVLAATEADLNQRERQVIQRATDTMRDHLATLAALDNQALLLQQTAAQSERNISATRTADAVEDARQRTQIALDYSATQAQLQQNATHVQIDYQNTQAALNSRENASVAAAQAVSTTTPAVPTLTSLPPTPTSTVMLPPPSDTPFANNAIPVFEAFFTDGINQDDWETSADADWNARRDGIVALHDGAGLRTRRVFDRPLTVMVDIEPAVVVSGEYDIVLNLADGAGIVVQIMTSGLAADRIIVAQFSESPSGTNWLFDPDNLNAVEEADVDLLLRSNTRIEVNLQEDMLTVTLNDLVLLAARQADRYSSGSIGVQVPAGTIVQQIQIQAQ